MRIDGFSSQSYPIKRAPRKAPVRDESVDDAEVIEEAVDEQAAAPRRNGGLPARQQDLIFPRARDRRTATALASYLSTAGFTDWDMEVLGLDLYI
ncbi:hypothetical protein C4Q28_07125 [Pseudomonas sp. SWI6]|uniref:Uncharacterized protein n=1 Tax=Pseudomonas taiwanensis TaxID=470150 RepID=A0ABR6V4Z5_9PSED|nr:MULTISPECIES: hypothetical protein [Pseudomonas]AGZ36704.1 hypothetical protein PVLB_19615 [Pseudomonas sp. VLB120]AVD81956.1 hypothetical protein C4Q28_07125 [Pseudomonas sp. SWI6]AVD88908.1 hypothetical protein C4Q26_17895 [Pseudomonas sp. SWI44]MBC3475563.1 hypothetical protein [Pseudomonas taiwanensis]MBC3491962.1 hypothetical protein [Pseudomonas taiwanensis]